MNKVLFLFFLFSIVGFSQDKNLCHINVNENNKKSAWDFINMTFNSDFNKIKTSRYDKETALCFLNKLSEIGDIKATSFLAQGYLYGMPIFEGINLQQAEKFFKIIQLRDDYENIYLTQKNLNTSLINLYSNNENKLIDVLSKRAEILKDQYSIIYLANLYRRKKGKEEDALKYYKQACNIGLNEGCYAVQLIKIDRKSFFDVVPNYSAPPPPPSKKDQ